jgi:hypothetical protein
MENIIIIHGSSIDISLAPAYRATHSARNPKTTTDEKHQISAIVAAATTRENLSCMRMKNITCAYLYCSNVLVPNKAMIKAELEI